MDAYFFASDYCKMYKTGGWRERDVLDHLKKKAGKRFYFQDALYILPELYQTLLEES